jgi:GTPase SAR1 family protein
MLKIYTTNAAVDRKINLIKTGWPRPEKGAFRWVLVGASGSGKSTLIKNVLFNLDLGYQHYFDEIFVFSGSMDDCEELETLVEARGLKEKIVIVQTFSNELVKDLFQTIERDPRHPRALIIADDQLANGISSRGTTNVIDELFQRGRHAGISVMISTQKYRSLNNNIRLLNVTNLTVFSSTNKVDIDAIADEHSGILDKKAMLAVMKNHLMGKYDFVTFDYNESPMNRLKDSNFKQISLN